MNRMGTRTSGWVAGQGDMEGDKTHLDSYEPSGIEANSLDSRRTAGYRTFMQALGGSAQ